MTTHVETTSRPALRIGTRIALALVATAGAAVLASARPQLPWTPWQAIQPTPTELLRQAIVCLAWLALAAICVRAGWLAVSPPRRHHSIVHAPPRWLPPRRRLHPPPRRTDSRELVHLFARPRTNAEAAPAPTDARPVDVERGGAASLGIDNDTPLRIQLIGPLRVGGPDGETPRERATRGLIAYLILKRAPASLDELAEALWPGENPAKTRQRLWKAKRQAQKLLGESLVRQHDSYALDLTRIRTDIDELDQLRTTDSSEQLERLITLAEQEPLADVPYAWADGERRRLLAIQADLIGQLAERRLQAGEASAALAGAERLIRIDPLNERGWCLAMEADGALGNRQAILDRYERLTRELDERLGLKPSGQARETYRRLLSQRP